MDDRKLSPRPYLVTARSSNDRIRRWPSALVVIELALLAAIACRAGASPSATPTSVAPTVSAAWSDVLGQIDDAGMASKDTALQAFSVAFGPAEGESEGAGVIPSGTPAVRWLVAYWDELTPEQQEAATGLLPQLAEINGAATLRGPGLAGPVAEPMAAATAPPARSDSDYTEIARAVAEDIGSSLVPNRALSIPVEAQRGPTNAFAFTSVVNANGGKSGAAARCVITVGPALDMLLADDDVGAVIAHEVWHCFEGDIMGLVWFWSVAPAWIDEGQAEWVGDTMFPTAGTAGLFWPPYLDDPAYPLFKRAYSAVGFYSQLDSSGADVWSRLIPMLQAADNVSAFQAAGADADSFLDRWASGYLRDDSRGDAWEIAGPGVTADRALPTNIHLPNGGSVGDSAAPYTNEIEILVETPDVLVATFSGHARISDASGHDYVIGDGGSFCLRSTGCECPQGPDLERTPPLPLDAASVALAVTGGTTGASGTLDGLSLKDYCGQTIAGTWVGTWQNDNGLASGGFTLEVTQKGKSFSGTIEVTGPTCVRQGTVQGTVAGTTVTWGVVGAERDVDFTGTLRGDSMSGTWSAIACGPPYGPANVTIPVAGIWQAARQ